LSNKNDAEACKGHRSEIKIAVRYVIRECLLKNVHVDGHFRQISMQGGM